MVDAREYHERTKHSPERLREDATAARAEGDREDDFALDPATKPRPYKRYRNVPRVDLASIRPPTGPTLSAIAEPRADPLAGVEGTDRPAIDRETVATLCYEASGIVQRAPLEDGREVPFRAASCTGKLYHVDCYLAVGDVDGLDPGLYHFDPRTMGLDVLREGDYRGALAEAVGETGDGADEGDRDGVSPGVADAPLTVVATSTWWRNAWKYRERTYRHAFWDAGTILANLLAAAHALDHRGAAVAGFADDRVADLLGVDPEREAPVAVAPIGAGDPAPDPPAIEPIDPAVDPLPDGREEHPLIYEAWAESTLPDGDAVAGWRGTAAGWHPTATRPGETSSGDGDRVPLDPVDHETASARPLHATVIRRGSRREYAREGPTRRQVGTVLDRATRGVPGDWNGGAADGLAFNDVYVLATGIEDVPDGSYRFHPGEATLERLGDVSPAEKTRLALGQEWAGDAHANVYLLADVDAVVDRLGDRGYRLAQLEAGITLGRLYLATYAHRDLGGTGLTFFDDLVTDHLSPRAAGRTPTTLFAFGRTAE